MAVDVVVVLKSDDEWIDSASCRLLEATESGAAGGAGDDVPVVIECAVELATVDCGMLSWSSDARATASSIDSLAPLPVNGTL